MAIAEREQSTVWVLYMFLFVCVNCNSDLVQEIRIVLQTKYNNVVVMKGDTNII